MLCIIYAVAVVAMTAVWVYKLRNRSFTFLAYAMYFPGALAPLFAVFSDEGIIDFLITISGWRQPVQSAVYSIVSLVFVYVCVEACVALAVTCGWAETAKTHKSAIHDHNKSYIPGFLRAAGEEVGWRCFLLPCLLQTFQPVTALLVSGLFWGLFHVPVMVHLTQLLKTPRPVLTVLVQSLACMMCAFPHGWVAVKSGYSLWASTVMHWFWNIYNPATLGSIYTNLPGRYQGQQWLINGEGLTGILVLLPVAIVTGLDLTYNLT